MWKKKIFEGDPPLLPDIHFYRCVCVAQQIINSLYIYFFLEKFFFFFQRTWQFTFKSKDKMKKINNSFKILGKTLNIIISHP